MSLFEIISVKSESSCTRQVNPLRFRDLNNAQGVHRVYLLIQSRNETILTLRRSSRGRRNMGKYPAQYLCRVCGGLRLLPRRANQP